MIISSYKVVEVIKISPKTSDYSIDGSPDIVVYSIRLAYIGDDLSETPTNITEKLTCFIDSKAPKVGDVIYGRSSSTLEPPTANKKLPTATITGVEIAADEKHPNRIEKLYSVKTDLLKKSFTVYGDSEGANIPYIGQKINLWLSICDDGDVEVSADEFPEPFDEYTELIK
ncbi:hypothetical protein IPL85_06240 [Candidatus Saccharibacteria bacterium]|nr:MAG: hypothetical protein IPL85_06240 [Candidatus Saccharibacteria bacterium]